MPQLRDRVGPGTHHLPGLWGPVQHADALAGVPTYGVRGLGLAAALAVGATTALYLVTALYLAVGAVLAERAAASRDVDLLRGVVLAEGLLGLPFTLVYLVAAALVMIWLFRARKNTDAFPGVHPQLNAHWAISGWWVPFANLVMPCKVMAGVTRDTFSRTRTPALVGVWLVYGVADMFAGFAGEAYDPAVGAGGRFQDVVDHYRAALLPNLLPAVACVVAGVALIMLIQRVSAASRTGLTGRRRPGRSPPAGRTRPSSPARSARRTRCGPSPGRRLR